MTTTTPEVGTVNLLDKLTEGRKLPRGCDSWAINERGRFFAKVVVEQSGCWRWGDFIASTGYGTFYFSAASRRDGAPKRTMAHRAAWLLFRGPIPIGFQIDHLCRVRKCVNPDHLEPVTQRENLLRGETVTALNASRTHCPTGHAYDETNTRITLSGGRVCRACHRTRESRRRSA